MNDKIKFIDLFGGIGGFRLGMEKYGHECVWYNDIDKYCVSVYNRRFVGFNRRFEEKYEAKDIREVEAGEIPDHDLVCAGFPCQSFSIAGRRQGFDDIRGTLFFEIARILKQKRPRCVLLENVWGLLSHDKGKSVQRILKILAELGYRVQWQVLNSKDFGVPQNRNRVFIIGHLGEGSGRQIFPIGESGETHDTKSGCKQLSDGEGIAYALDANYYKGVAQQSRTMVQVADSYNGSVIGNEAKTLRTNEGCCRTGNIIISDSGLHRKPQLRNETIPPLRANTGAGWDNLVVPDVAPLTGGGNVAMIQRPHGFNKGGEKELPCLRASAYEQNEFVIAPRIRAEHHDNLVVPDSAPTLTGGGHSGGHHSDMCIIPEHGRIRRLTPVECERLQGFPDGWTAEGIDNNGEIVKISDTQRYRQLGNAVTVTVVEAIARRMWEVKREK